MIGKSLYEKNCNYKIHIKKLEYKKIAIKFRKKYLIENLKDNNNMEFDNLNNLINEKNEIKIFEINFNLLSQIIEKRNIYKIKENNIYYLISKITQFPNCCKYFSKLNKMNLEIFLNICLNNILEKNHFIKYSNFILNNIFLDSKDNYFLNLIFQSKNIEEKLIKIINIKNFYDEFQKNNIIILFYHIFEKRKNFTENFITNFIKTIEILSYKENIIFFDLIYILSILITNNPKKKYFIYMKNILKKSIKIFNSINSLEIKQNELFFRLIDFFNLYLFLNDDQKENKELILEKDFLNIIISLLINENKNIKLKALYLIGNIILQFDNIDKFIIWENNYKKIFDFFLLAVYLEEENIKIESLICLKNLFEQTTEDYLENFIEENINNLIEFVRMSLINDNPDIIINKIFEILQILIRNINFANELMCNDNINKIFEEKQNNINFSEELDNLIKNIKYYYYE